jgi:hypothetical protein
MKKILAVICFGFLSLNYANAEISMGVSGNVGILSANGTEKISGSTNDATSGVVIWGEEEAAAVTDQAATAQTKQSQSDEMAIGYVSLFTELGVFNTGLRIGLSYVPYALESETTQNNRNDNCSNDESHLDANTVSDADVNVCSQTTNKVQVDLEDLMTLYVAYHHELDSGPLSAVFIKAGVMEADVVTNELLATGSSYGNTQLNGEFIGVGVEKNLEDAGLFIRAEANLTDFENIHLKANNSGSNTNSIDITGLDGATATFSIGKTF